MKTNKVVIQDKIKRANNLHNTKHSIWKNSATSGPSVTHEERKAHVKSALDHQAPPDLMGMSDKELYQYALKSDKVTVLENELLHRLESFLY
tara:strand:- start:591 stop:866 length:276 start_codon:yes stop_codon:yes gene_type:complete